MDNLPNLTRRVAACEAKLGLAEAKPAPEPSLEQRLRDAGATSIQEWPDCCPDLARAFTRPDGKVDVIVNGLTPASACAALRSATEKP